MIGLIYESNLSYSKGLYRVRKRINQSNLLLISDLPQAIFKAIESIKIHRYWLEYYILHHPEYLYSLSPVKVEEKAPRIIKLAAFAAELMNVGPMAAIPGALAELGVEVMIREGGLVNLIENGGEISAFSLKPINVGVYAGKSPLSGKIGFHLTKDDFPIGIATSSSTITHALSFGEADATIIIADSSSIADAAATAVCNVVKGSDIEASIQSGLELAENLPYVRGALIIRDKYAGLVGKLPQFIKFNGSINEIFKASLYEVLPNKKFL
ncbi:MAG: UPF0280 family protein [Nitrososphaerales archaeon]